MIGRTYMTGNIPSMTSGLLPHTMSGSAHTSEYREGNTNPITRVGGAIFARVISVNWLNRTVDCVGMYTHAGAGPWSNIPILSSIMTQSEGVHWLPTITDTPQDNIRNQSQMSGILDAIAVLDFIHGDIMKPICLGFISSGPNEFSTGEVGTKIERHASGVYSRTTIDGMYEFSFPDGTFFKVAPTERGTQLEDLTGTNVRDTVERPWSIPISPPRTINMAHPTGTQITVSEIGSVNVVIADGAEFAVTHPSGSVIQISSDGTLSVVASGMVNINAGSGSITINNVDLVVHTHTDNHGHSASTGTAGSDNHSHSVSISNFTGITGTPQ